MRTDQHGDEPTDESPGATMLVKTLAILFVTGIYLIILLKVLVLK